MNSLIPQINEIITDLFDKGYYPDDLTKPFSNKLFWDQSIPYESAKLNFDHAEMSLTGWINAAELITGSDESFNTMLIEAFKNAITEQWELRMAVLVGDGYNILELHAEHKGDTAA
jgi:hypothetical protein